MRGDPRSTQCAQSRRSPLTLSSGDMTYPASSIQVTAREQDMNAPPNIDPVTAHSDSDVVHWLTNDTRDERFIDNIFAELCVRLQRRRTGVPQESRIRTIVENRAKAYGQADEVRRDFGTRSRGSDRKRVL